MSKKPRKQRRRALRAKLHEVGVLMSAHLSKELRKTTNKRALPLRTGDKVKIMRGKYKGTTGKITEINRQKRQVLIENVLRKKADGTEKGVPFRASNLVIIDAELDDNRRIKGMKIKGKEKEVRKETAPEKKDEKVKEKEVK